jgi:RHS repeat-associated protein
LGSAQAGIQGPLDPCGGGTGSNPIGYAFASSCHHRDHLGSLRAETDEAGNRTVKRDYYAFGIEQQGYAASAEAATARQFTGAEKGFFNGLDSMMARFNSGNAGRFLSPDPILGNATNPQSWNRYSFVLNSPLNYTDPTGKIWKRPEQEAGSPTYNTLHGSLQIQANNGGPTAFELQTAAALQDMRNGWQGPTLPGSPQEAAMQQLVGLSSMSSETEVSGLGGEPGGHRESNFVSEKQQRANAKELVRTGSDAALSIVAADHLAQGLGPRQEVHVLTIMKVFTSGTLVLFSAVIGPEGRSKVDDRRDALPSLVKLGWTLVTSVHNHPSGITKPSGGGEGHPLANDEAGAAAYRAGCGCDPTLYIVGSQGAVGRYNDRTYQDNWTKVEFLVRELFDR